jgi:hypothetical protein
VVAIIDDSPLKVVAQFSTDRVTLRKEAKNVAATKRDNANSDISRRAYYFEARGVLPVLDPIPQKTLSKRHEHKNSKELPFKPLAHTAFRRISTTTADPHDPIQKVSG